MTPAGNAGSVVQSVAGSYAAFHCGLLIADCGLLQILILQSPIRNPQSECLDFESGFAEPIAYIGYTVVMASWVMTSQQIGGGSLQRLDMVVRVEMNQPIREGA